MTDGTALTGRGLDFSYGRKQVLRGVDVTAAPGRVLGLIGPNGSGKTTLLRLLYGSLAPDAGAVTLGERPLSDLAPRERAQTLAVVVQEGAGEAALSAAEMTLLGRNPHVGMFGRLTQHDYEVVGRALERVGAAHLGSRDFAGLSGGEKQRVLIARALVQEARYLLLDEPTNHLDIRYQHEILHLVHNLGQSAIVVLHDLNLAARYCDDVVVLSQGRVAAAGPATDVLDPKLLSEVYGVDVRRHVLDGDLHLLFRRQESAPSH